MLQLEICGMERKRAVLTHSGLPAQTVGERRRSCGVALSVKGRNIPPGAQRPEGGGGAWQV